MSSSLLTSRVAFAKDVLSKSEWISKAVLHKQTLDSLLYPGTDKRTSIKHRAHQISKHPIYNFLHTYYRYSVGDLRKYSPGVSAFLEEASLVEHRDILDENFMTFNDAGGHYTAACILQRESSGKRPDGKYAHMPLSAMRDILRATQERPPFLACYGLHEWAMLYSGNKPAQRVVLSTKRFSRDGVDGNSADSKQTSQSADLTMGNTPVSTVVSKRHQPSLSLRVSQATIDAVVYSSKIRCTHFDAWRFFHPKAQPLNIVSPMSRAAQAQYEQPGCIHANMDLFKYAYVLYPLVSSDLLLDALRLAIRARKIDMRASPYDVARFEGCEEPLCIETAEGRQLYAAEQESLAAAATPIRKRLLDVYDAALS